MITTENIRGIVGAREVPRYPPYTHKQQEFASHTKQQEKEQGRAKNYQVPKKLTKPKRGESKIKIVKKN